MAASVLTGVNPIHGLYASFAGPVAVYGRQLDDVGGRLYVAGIDLALMAQAERTRSIPKDGPVKLYEARPIIGQSSLDAFHEAQRWVEAR